MSVLDDFGRRSNHTQDFHQGAGVHILLKPSVPNVTDVLQNPSMLFLWHKQPPPIFSLKPTTLFLLMAKDKKIKVDLVCHARDD